MYPFVLGVLIRWRRGCQYKRRSFFWIWLLWIMIILLIDAIVDANDKFHEGGRLCECCRECVHYFVPADWTTTGTRNSVYRYNLSVQYVPTFLFEVLLDVSISCMTLFLTAPLVRWGSAKSDDNLFCISLRVSSRSALKTLDEALCVIIERS